MEAKGWFVQGLACVVLWALLYASFAWVPVPSSAASWVPQTASSGLRVTDLRGSVQVRHGLGSARPLRSAGPITLPAALELAEGAEMDLAFGSTRFHLSEGAQVLFVAERGRPRRVVLDAGRLRAVDHSGLIQTRWGALRGADVEAWLPSEGRLEVRAHAPAMWITEERTETLPSGTVESWPESPGTEPTTPPSPASESGADLKAVARRSPVRPPPRRSSVSADPPPAIEAEDTARDTRAPPERLKVDWTQLGRPKGQVLERTKPETQLPAPPSASP